MKKYLSFVLILTLVFSFTVNTFADKNTVEPSDKYIVNDKPVQIEEKKSTEQMNNDINDMTDITITATTLPSSPSNALAITTYPYYSLDCYMSGGAAGYVKYTSSYDAYFSIYTKGSLDTYIEAYDSVSLANKIGEDDDAGHSLNACLTVYLNSNTTYYFKVRGYGSSQTGSYTLVFHRGLPTSGYEKPDNFTTFNSSTYQSYNNCYTYALNCWKNPVTGNKFRINGQNPGEMSGNAITLDDLSDAATAYNSITAACEADAIYYGGDFLPIDEWDQPDIGYYKVALVLDPGVDYHWYRETPNGRWTHKPGTTAARYADESGYYIYLPDQCDTGSYTEFLGYFQVKAPVISAAALELTDTVENTKSYPQKDNLTIDMFMKFAAGESIDDVKSSVGQEHSYVGSGYIGNVYVLEDGTKVAVYYSNGVVDQIRILNDDGSYTVLVK